MSPRAERPIMRNRGAHTVYLSDETWEALERCYLQLRLAGKETTSKIEFIEATMQAGLEALTKLAKGRPSTNNTEEPTATIVNTLPNNPQLSKEEPTFASRNNPVAQPNRTELSRSRNRARSSALDRLRQASDPGRPAPIQSVATIDN